MPACSSPAWTPTAVPPKRACGRGDVIVAANRQAIRNLKNLREAARLDSQQILLRVYRSGRFGYIAVR